jgi:AcrR family transcriptional regulator
MAGGGRSGRAAGQRQPYHHGDLRRALVEAAAELVAEGGIPALTLRAAAQRAGVSHAAPYHHFRDKAALVAAVADEGFGRLDRALAEAAAAPAASPRERLAALGRAYVRFAVENPHYFRVMFRPELAPPGAAEGPEAHGPAARAFGRLVEAVTAVLRAEGRPEGGVPAGTLVAWAGVHGLASLWLDGPLSRMGLAPAGIEALARLVTGAQLEAVRAAGAPEGG